MSNTFLQKRTRSLKNSLLLSTYMELSSTLENNFNNITPHHETKTSVRDKYSANLKSFPVFRSCTSCYILHIATFDEKCL